MKEEYKVVISEKQREVNLILNRMSIGKKKSLADDIGSIKHIVVDYELPESESEIINDLVKGCSSLLTENEKKILSLLVQCRTLNEAQLLQLYLTEAYVSCKVDLENDNADLWTLSEQIVHDYNIGVIGRKWCDVLCDLLNKFRL